MLITVFVLTSLFVATPNAANAAETKIAIPGVIFGKVTNAATGAPIPNVLVLVSDNGAPQAQASTDKIGVYKIENLRVGTAYHYSVATSISGYCAGFAYVRLTAAQPAVRRDFTLSQGTNC